MSGTNDSVNMLAFRIVLTDMFTTSFMSTNRTTTIPPTVFPGDSSGSALRSGLGSYEITAFPLVPGACKTLCAPSKGGVPLPSLVQLLCSGPTGLQSQMLLGFFSQCPGPRLGKLV